MQDVGFVASPPGITGKYFHFDGAVVTGRFHLLANAAQIDHAIAHHAAIQQQVPGGHQPVGQVQAQDAFLRAGAVDLLVQLGVPPTVVNVHRDAQAVAGSRLQHVAQVQGLFQRRQAGAVCRIHRVQGFQRQ
ncbi:hypothetical protein D3C85_1275100 [compost metagenome]